MPKLHYINSKLYDAINILTTHEGDARTRLAKILPKVQRLPIKNFPQELQDDFMWVKDMLDKGNKNPISNVLPAKLTGIQNKTASKVIRKIIFIQNQVDLLIEESIHKNSSKD
ncbi:MAG: hypothetical protein K8S13_09265 [Desulfobacula sp.]|uniref:hypothetical protein n=1 Tax=Desulfobacula sp. TaxID=2593537 RepID=UPI0025B949AC|nr:hypothetical protein [Desulfobacula sp.]MCD4720033.1 hypothetical protein [Desulfobacula sp.]